MILSNYHSHCNLCDGKGTMEEYVQRAIELKFTSFGFSCHAPMNFEFDWPMKEENLSLYIKEVDRLKKEYGHLMEIYLGLEIDFFNEKTENCIELYNKLGLDYYIGSIHCIYHPREKRFLSLDHSKEQFLYILTDIFRGDIKAFVKEYYRQIQNMVTLHAPPIIGHLDLIKKFNTGNNFFDESEDWYMEEIKQALKVIKSKHSIIEINTGGISRGYITDYYPSFPILKECNRLEIPITINSDAHTVETLDFQLGEAELVAKEAGYDKKYVFLNKEWKSVVI